MVVWPSLCDISEIFQSLIAVYRSRKSPFGLGYSFFQLQFIDDAFIIVLSTILFTCSSVIELFFDKPNILFSFRNANQLIALVPSTHEKHSTLAIKARPSHCWINNETLAIGWYDTVSICIIVSSSDSQVILHKLPQVLNRRRL